MSDDETDFRSDVLRHFGRLEALADSHAKQSRDRHLALVEDVRLLGKEVTRSHERLDAHDEVLSRSKDRSQKSSHDLSEFQSEVIKREQAVVAHVKRLEQGQIAIASQFHVGTVGQNRELGTQTRKLSRIEVLIPLLVALCAALQAYWTTANRPTPIYVGPPTTIAAPAHS